MPSRHLLLLDASELTLFSGPPSRLGEVQRFSQDEAARPPSRLGSPPTRIRN